MNELKKCPFCGGEAWIFKTHEGTYAVMHESSDCPITSESYQGNWVYDSLEEAIKAWNTRKPVDKVIERLEESKKNICGRYNHETPLLEKPSYKMAFNNGIERAIEILKEELM